MSGSSHSFFQLLGPANVLDLDLINAALIEGKGDRVSNNLTTQLM